MKIFLIDNNIIHKYSLPNRNDESFLITYNYNNKDFFISFFNKDTNWYIASNGGVNILNDGKVIEKVRLEYFHKYLLKIIGKDKLLELYFIPAIDNLFKLSFNNLDSFSIGSSVTANICYPSENVSNIQAIFKKNGKDWIISTLNDDRFNVYINNNKITLKKLYNGDVIFLAGLKVIWMDGFIWINNPMNSVKVAGLLLVDDEFKKETIYDVSDEEKNVGLYNKDDYFAHYPLIKETISEKEVDIDAPPTSEKTNSMPFILSMGTTIVMVSSSFVMGYNVFYGLYNGRSIWQVLPQIVMCVAMLIGSLILPKISKAYLNKQATKKELLRVEKYKEYLNSKERTLQLMIKNDMQILNDDYPSNDLILSIIDRKSRNFWWRQYDDNEFLTLRVGVGRIKTNILINAPEEHFTLEEDELLNEVYKIKNKYQYMDGAPITISLLNNRITSIIGKNNDFNLFVNGLIAQIVALHSANDVKLVLFTNENSLLRWDFFRFLPHAFSSARDIRFFASNEEDAKILSNYLELELKKRKENLNDDNVNNKKNIKPDPYYVIFTDNYSLYKNISIIKTLVSDYKDIFGFSFVVISDDIKKVPDTCTAFVEVSQNDGVVIEKQTGLNMQKIFYLDKNSNELNMKDIAKKLLNIPILINENISVLPSSVPFLDMFGVSKIEHLNIINRWQSNNPVISLDTIIGVHKGGEKFKLDLHEKFHGPHGLVAGSTGSGKSEFIITYILSMAINYHPYEVQFVLIDYKGGGLAGAFYNKESGVKIPHLVGTITNLDISDMNRTLVSIQSELNRRQKIFNNVRDELGEGTIDIYKYQKLYREGLVEKPLAHLFIVCDEFAELKQQRPEFMQQLISASRIGRSLGIHLILATQKPSGVVNDQIWANSKFKVCFKVQERSDSMEMLKRPEAAAIKEAGRFYLQVGYNDYFDIGQSGWSGAKYVPSDKIITKNDESINFINNIGYTIKSIKNIDNNNEKKVELGDQLTNIVKYIYNLGKKENIVTHNLWLPPLPSVVDIKKLKEKYNFVAKSYEINLVIGEYDDPVNQLQNILTVDLTNSGNLLIYGASGSGKEKLLFTLLYSLFTTHRPDEAHVYIVDCGSESLKIFNKIPHVGDILTVDEHVKINDLLTMVVQKIDERKELFADYAGSYVDYLKNSGQKLPMIIVIINNFDVFSESYSRIIDGLGPLFRDGAKYGIVFIVTAIATNAVRSKFVNYFNNKICLQLANDYEYRDITGSPRGITPAKIFGRGMVSIDKNGYEFQTASFALESELTNKIRELTKVLCDAYATKAPKVPTIPDKIGVYDMISKIKDNNYPIGYNIYTKQIFSYNLVNNNFLIIGATNIDEKKISFVHSLIRMLAENKKNYVEVIDFANAFNKNIENVSVVNKKEKYEKGFITLYNRVVQEKMNQYYFILGASSLMSKISPQLYKAFSKLLLNVKKYSNVHFILVDVSNGYRELMIEEWYQENVNSKNGIWLGNNISNQILLSISDITNEEKNMDFDYMAFVVENSQKTIIKHVIDMEEML